LVSIPFGLIGTEGSKGHPSLKKGVRDSKIGRKIKNSGLHDIMMISSRAHPSHSFKSNY